MYVPHSQTFDTLPCSLTSRCRLDAHFRFHTGERLDGCLRNQKVVLLGDSTLGESALTLLFLLTHGTPAFASALLGLEWKFQSGADQTTVAFGPYHVSFHPNQRNFTFTDTARNLSMAYLHSGGVNLTDHQGIGTLSDPRFEADLRRLGVVQHPHAAVASRASMVVFSTTFHDDTNLASECNRTNGSCACDESWHAKESRYTAAARAASRLISAVATAGPRVVFVTLFARASSRPAGVDLLRAFADETMRRELSRAGFFEAGGRWVGNVA